MQTDRPSPALPATASTDAALPRRRLLTGAALAAAASAPVLAARAAPSPKPSAPLDGGVPHKIVYQLNKPEEEYREAIFNSISAMLQKYTDDVAIAVVVWGPGIHLLAKNPKRPVSKLHQQRARSLAESYGVRFFACGNTMHTIGWTAADMVDYAIVEDVGAATIMELQEKGYAYLAW
ncbi:MAG: DsrE family protein [Pseudomonadota bacterium]